MSILVMMMMELLVLFPPDAAGCERGSKGFVIAWLLCEAMRIFSDAASRLVGFCGVTCLPSAQSVRLELFGLIFVVVVVV